MKKIIISLFMLIGICGCSSNDSVNITNEFVQKVKKLESYRLVGTMELFNDEEMFNYSIDVSYLKNDNYKVEMVNAVNNHKQIILKNSEGLYVVTPSLNKSFKFESSWPDNSSQAYILKSLIKDIENDSSKTIEKDDDIFIIKCKVDYPNNTDLKYQKIYVDNKFNLKMVEVFGESDLPKIKVVVKDVDLNASLKESEFKLDNFIADNACEDDVCDSKTTLSEMDSAIYPLYMPYNTFLTSSEIVNNDDTSRIILTFTGDKNYVIVEESASVYNDHEIIPVYGEPLLLNDSIAALSNNSMYWTSNNIDYYIVSEDLSVMEMVYIASSLGNSKTTIAPK